MKQPLNRNEFLFEEIALSLDQLPPISRESKLRDLLSNFPDCIDAWYMLIDLVMRNGNHIEAIRLVRFALNQLKNKTPFINTHFDLLLELKMWDVLECCPKLSSNQANKNIEISLDNIEFQLLRNPARGFEVLKEFCAENPMNFRLMISLSSAISIAKFGIPSICFFLSSKWHWTIQRPITEKFDELRMPYYVTTKTWALNLLRPKIVVISDPAPELIRWLRANLPQTKIVSTRHGIGVGGKNYGLYAAAATDFICVTSQSIKNDLCKRALLGLDQVWVTGFSQMDGLFQSIDSHAYTSTVKSVTYAPTFDQRLSSIEIIGDDPIRWILGNNQNINLTIRPHPHLFRLNPTLMSMWKENANQKTNVFFDDSRGSELSDLLIRTDLLISDISSVALQFIALNRPIICLVDLEKAKLSSKYAPSELEWQMHAGARVVTEKDKLSNTVDSLLSNGDDSDTIADRDRLRNYLFGDLTDGNASYRIATHLSQLASTLSSH